MTAKHTQMKPSGRNPVACLAKSPRQLVASRLFVTHKGLHTWHLPQRTPHPKQGRIVKLPQWTPDPKQGQIVKQGNYQHLEAAQTTALAPKHVHEGWQGFSAPSSLVGVYIQIQSQYEAQNLPPQM